MPDTNTNITGKTGSRTVRLADVDDDIRIKAARRLMDETNDVDEYLRLLELAFIPGDAGGRVAA